MSAFEQLYLISKILVEALPLELLTFKCLLEWKPSGDVSIVDMGNGFRVIKFSSVMDRNKVLYGQPWFVRGQIYCL